MSWSVQCSLGHFITPMKGGCVLHLTKLFKTQTQCTPVWSPQIVDFPHLVVQQDVSSSLNFRKLLTFRIAGASVWVVLQRQTFVLYIDLIFGRQLATTQNGIQILISRHFLPKSFSHNRSTEVATSGRQSYFIDFLQLSSQLIEYITSAAVDRNRRSNGKAASGRSLWSFCQQLQPSLNQDPVGLRLVVSKRSRLETSEIVSSPCCKRQLLSTCTVVKQDVHTNTRCDTELERLCVDQRCSYGTMMITCIPGIRIYRSASVTMTTVEIIKLNFLSRKMAQVERCFSLL